MGPETSAAARGLVLVVALAAGCAAGAPGPGTPAGAGPAASPSASDRSVTGAHAGGGRAPATGPAGQGAADAASAPVPGTSPRTGATDADASASLPSAPAADRGSPSAPDAAPAEVLTGLAAVYSDRLVGRRTANGERYDRTAMTAAHRTLPLGTVLRVTNPRNGRSVELRINDRGPFHAERILDLSVAAAIGLGLDPRSVSRVEATVVSRPTAAR